MRKTVKKIAALVAGTTMVGATIMGAMALDLSNYPAPFVTNGVFSGKLVVGAKAATSDVMGAIDIAASLQAASKTTTTIELPDTAGKATVTGDAAEFKTGSDILGIGEALSDVKTTFTADDLNALKSGEIDTGIASTPVKQYLKFGTTDASVVYGLNDDDILGDHLLFADGAPLFEYHMEFTEGAKSEIGTGGALDDYDSEVLTILGAPFTIVEATKTGAQIEMTLLGGQVADTLRDGETKTYTIDGKDYEVTAVFIGTDPNSAKLSVNGQLTKELGEGDTQVLGSDITVGVQDILTNQREGIVEFYLGANKIKLTDADFADADYVGDGTVKVGTVTVDNADLIIKGSNTSTEFTLNYIKYQVEADDDFYVPAGKGLKEFMTQKQALLTDTWDIKYAGLMKTGVSALKLAPVSDHSYKLEFENVNGDAYNVPYVSTKDGDFSWGQEATKGRLVFTEWNDGGGDPQADVATFISQKDYFVLADKETDALVEDKAITNVLKYVSTQTSTKIVNFEDLAGGTFAVSYTGLAGDDAEGELIVGGKSHTFYVGDDNVLDVEKYALSMDLDGEGGILDGTQIFVVIKGGGILDLGGAQAFTDGVLDAITGPVVMDLTTPEAAFDEALAAETSTVEIDEVVGDDTALTFEVTAPALETDDVNDKYSKGMTDYGVYFEQYVPDTGAPTLKVEYPLTQRGAQVFVTAGTVEVKEGSASAGGTIDSTTLNPIGVGMAVLDTDAMALIGKENLIVVGGPCVNSVAASLMGNPATCTDGFTPGKAVIKLFADKNALLVAGYNAQDSLGASYVLGDFEKYGLTGTEVEVVVADINTISVNKVQ